MHSPIVHILPIAHIRRKRTLPFPGKITKRQGVKVFAVDVVAETDLAPEHALMDIMRGLGLPASEADHYLQRAQGAEVTEGDILAGPVGLPRRVIRATRPGKVVLAGGGHVLLQLKSRPFELKAGLTGTITELFPEWGVTIETTGGLVQGVWGNGKIGMGQLTVVAKSLDEELISTKLDMSMHQSVLMGGYCSSADVLRQAEDLPLRGLILAGMSAALIPLAQKMNCPVILLEGFGKIPLNEAAYRLLSTSERNEVTINAEPWDRLTGNRPEVILNVPEESRPMESAETGEFENGKPVRIVRPPMHGSIGELTSLLGLTSLANGVVAQAAEVTFANGEKSVFPLTNLEVLK